MEPEQEHILEGFKLSPHQARLWQQLVHKGFETRGAVRLDGPLDQDRLTAALRKLVEHHSALRTSFHRLPGMEIPIQVIQEEPALAGALGRESEADLERGSVLAAHLLTSTPESHVLVLTVPSVCCDARGLVNAVRDLGLLYAGEELEERIQYLQFSEWCNEILEGEDAAEGERFWRQRTAGKMVRPALPLETRGAAPAPPRRIEQELPAGLPAQIEPAFLQTCWQVLLGRLATDPDFLLYSLVDGRKYEELADGIGLFSSYLPFPAPLSGELGFAEALGRMQEALEEAGTWQEHYRGLERLETAGDPADLPVGFAVLDEPGVAPWAGLRASWLELDSRQDRFKLCCTVIRRDGRLSLRLEYHPGVYQDETVRRLADEMATLLRNAAEEPHTRLEDLEILGQEERRRVLELWNSTERDFGVPGTLHELIGAQAARTPQGRAVVCGPDSLTFAELDRQAGLLARQLRALGAGPGSLVGLLADRSLQTFVGLLGILQAGGAYLPLDPASPHERLAFMLEDSRAAALLVHGVSPESRPAFSGPVLDLGGEPEPAAAVPSPETSPDHLAYVIYTSGSTGTPKAVMIPHRSAANLLGALREAVYHHFDDRPLRIGVNAPLWFDASVKQILQLAHGHCLYVVPEAARLDGGELIRFAEENALDVLDCTPSQLKLMFSEGLAGRLDRAPTFLIGGEALDEESWRLLAAGARTDFNVYGPTECTVDTTVCLLRTSPHRPTLGRPIANVRTYVLDERLRPLPVGVAGELCIGGAGVGRGYLGRPDLTASKFLPDPFGRQPGGRLYRTGDLVRSREDGQIEFLGRIDHQVKLRGFRIELGEIESLLRLHPGVQDAVVTAFDDGGGPRLVAYAVPDRRFAATIDGRARYRLPNGMAVVHQNKNETDYLYEEIFEKKIYVQHGVDLPPDAVILDVGANIGMFTLFVSRQRPDARIFAFEPIPPIFESLRLNAELYGARVELLPFGLAAGETVETFTYYPRYSMMSGLAAYADPAGEVEIVRRYMENEERMGQARGGELLAHVDELLAGRFEGERHECRLRPLSAVLAERGIDHVDLLKIDVQRAEMEVLKGLSAADWTKIDQIVMEVHDAPGQATAGRTGEISALLRHHGFDVVVEQDVLLEGTDRYNLYAVRPDRRQPAPAPTAAAGPAAVELDVRALSGSELRAFLKDRLPEYMVPASYVLLDAFPLNRNGKVDRRALPPPDLGQREAGPGYVAPRTPREQALAEVWAQVLGVEKVGVHDNFFELGGDSIRSIQIRALALQKGLHFSTQQLFLHQTVEELARELEAAAEESAGPAPHEPFSLISAEDRARLPAGVEDAYPLARLQHGMLFHEQLSPEAAMYQNVNSLHLRARYDEARLREAVAWLLRRHPVLRTSFHLSEYSEPLQLVHREVELPLEFEDLRHLSRTEQERAFDALVESEKRTRFHWSRPPLVRFKIHRRDEETFQLTWSEHHAILDGWSLASMVADLFQRYITLLADPTVGDGPAVPVAFRDFVAAEREAIASEAHRRFWKAALEDASPAPLPRRPPAERAVPEHTRTHRVLLSIAVSDGLRGVASAAGVPLKSVLLAAHLRALAHSTGSVEVITGLVANSRPEVPGGDEVYGLFLNTLPFRLRLAGGTWLDLARSAFAAEQEMLPHRQLPLAEIQRLAGGGAPLFETMFNFTNFHVLDRLLQLDEIQVLGRKSAVVDLNLTLTAELEVEPGSDQIGLRLDYNAAELTEDQIQTLGGAYARILEQMATAPGSRYELFSPLSGAERSQLLGEQSRTAAAPPAEILLHRWVEVQAAAAPEKPALLDRGRRITYGELDLRANRLAHDLLQCGVRLEDRVGVLLERSADLVVALLAVLKAGGAYVPLDPGHPAERIAFTVEDSGARLVLTRKAHLQKLLQAPKAVPVCLGPEGAGTAGARESRPPDALPAGDRLAYVIYTSGSTGRPKGVGIRHSSAAALMDWAGRAFSAEELAVVLASTSIGFDLSVFEIFVPLAHAGSVALVDTVLDLPDLPAGSGVTLVNTVPSALPELLRRGLPASVRTVCLAGEPLARALVDRLYALGTVESVLNLYGPSEDTTYSTWTRLGPGTEPPGIGGPVDNTRAYLLDAHLQPVPAGAPGELYLAGAGLARGYLGRPDLTAERFLPDPFGSEPGARLYRTGDLARSRGKDDLEFLGRIDHQVKIRGHRIELGEIEAALASHPDVREAVVAATPPVDGVRSLLAYVVAPGRADLTVGELRSFLDERLPASMIPSAFVPLDALPRTPSGKVDRRALPAPEGGRLPLQRAYTAPRNAFEEEMVALWSSVLGIERVGVFDNFFELGGHSLLASRLMSRIQDTFSVDLPLRAFFAAPTVADLCTAVAESIVAQVGGQEVSRMLSDLESN